MKLSNKKQKYIKKSYPEKSVKQLASELNVSAKIVREVLGPDNTLTDRADLPPDRIQLINKTIGWLSVLVLTLAPFVFIRHIYEFNKLPQRVFIQTFVFVLVLFWFIKIRLQGRVEISGNPINGAALFFIIWSFLSLFWAHNLYEGLISVLHWNACGLFFFIIANNLREEKWMTRMLIGCMLACLGMSLLGMGQYLFEIDWVPQATHLGPAANFGNKNLASQFLSMVIPLTWIAVLFRQNLFIKWLGFITSVIATIFLIYTDTRAGWIAFVVSLILVAFLLYMDSGKDDSYVRFAWRQGLLFLLAVGIVFIFANLSSTGFQFRLGRIAERAASVGKVTELEKAVEKAPDESAYSSIQLRMAIWRNALEMIKDRPLLGYGAGNMKIYYPLYHRKAIVDKESGLRFRLEQAHNDYVQILVELGIIGFIVFGGLLTGFLFMVRRILKNISSPEKRLITIGIAGGVTGFAVQAVFSFPLQTAVPPFLFFAFLGIAAACCHKTVRGFAIPGIAAVFLLLCTLMLGTLQLKYNIKNILSAKYYYATLVAEKAGTWHHLLQSGLASYRYNPLRLQSLAMAARGYGETGRMEKSIRAFEKVVRAYPNDIVALSNLGISYSKTGQNMKAATTLERAIKMYPDEPSLRKELERVIRNIKTPDRGLKIDRSLFQ